MPSHPERARTASLPEGYQFGQAGPTLDSHHLPVRPLITARCGDMFSVELQHGTEAEITAGLTEIARYLSEGTFSAYARLEPFTAAETWFYGPVRRTALFSPFPPSGEPRMRHFLHVGVIGWAAFTTDRDHGDER